MVRDEADIIVSVVEHMLSQVDFVIVADNNSVDGTRELLDELAVTVVDDPDPAYLQSKKMTARLQAASSSGAPVLFVSRSDAGHGVGGSLKQVIDESVDLYAFLFHAIGMR